MQNNYSQSSKVRAICVDDDPIVRSLIGAKIAPLISEYVEAEDGIAAWNLMRDDAFDIAFIDLEMPNLDGFDLMRCMRGNDKTKHIPIIVISSCDDSGSVRKAFEAGASAFQSKPVNWVVFEPMVAHLLRLANAARELEARAGIPPEAPQAVRGFSDIHLQLANDLEQISNVARHAADSANQELMLKRLQDIASFSAALAQHVSSLSKPDEREVA